MTKPAHDTIATSQGARAQDVPSSERLRKLEERLAHLEAEVRRLSAKQAEFQHELIERVELD